MLAAFDCETRGLYGDIFIKGYYDGKNYVTFNSCQEFIDYILEVEKCLPKVVKKNKKYDKLIKDTLYLYAFNLEFDLGKILNKMRENGLPIELDPSESLIINSNFHRAKIAGVNIVFCDLYPIVKSSLKDAAISFQLDVLKMDLEEEDLEEYFKNVSPNDEKLLQYLESDVKATHELLLKVIEFSGLPVEAFVRCPTVASLAMKIFKTNMSADYEVIKNSTITKKDEEFIRSSYHGGRTEVFKNIGEGLLHYDVNSLYPSVMQENYFPTGKAYTSYVLGDITRDGELVTMDWLNELHKMYMEDGLLYIIKAEVDVPTDMNIPVLPIKKDNKLIFPVGVFSGAWCSPEFEYALQCGVKVNKIYFMMVWMTKKKVFENFVKEHRTIKETSTGGKRVFAKFIQNSLYGKFGMDRERVTYELKTDFLLERLTKNDTPYAEVCSFDGKTRMLVYLETVFADYIKPQFASFVTAYSRVELCKAAHYIEKNNGQVYYCDTDSIVTDIPLPADIVHDKEYGKWKLERKVKHGLFILPKLYAEVSDDGEEILKSKGIVKQFMKKTAFADYVSYYHSMVKGLDVSLYKNQDGYTRRRKVISALLDDGDFERKILLAKSLLFSNKALHKRTFDFASNTSTPLIIL